MSFARSPVRSALPPRNFAGFVSGIGIYISPGLHPLRYPSEESFRNLLRDWDRHGKKTALRFGDKRLPLDYSSCIKSSQDNCYLFLDSSLKCGRSFPRSRHESTRGALRRSDHRGDTGVFISLSSSAQKAAVENRKIVKLDKGTRFLILPYPFSSRPCLPWLVRIT